MIFFEVQPEDLALDDYINVSKYFHDQTLVKPHWSWIRKIS